jgi:hypothetical protein
VVRNSDTHEYKLEAWPRCMGNCGDVHLWRSSTVFSVHEKAAKECLANDSHDELCRMRSHYLARSHRGHRSVEFTLRWVGRRALRAALGLDRCPNPLRRQATHTRSSSPHANTAGLRSLSQGERPRRETNPLLVQILVKPGEHATPCVTG